MKGDFKEIISMIDKSNIKELIQFSFPFINNKIDLINLIIKVNDIIPISKNTKKINLNINDILYYSDFENKKLSYKSIHIRKKSGGERIIHQPIYKLKCIQRSINYILKSIDSPHPSAYGFIEKKSIVDNAKLHAKKKYIYNIDLKDFFYSFSFDNLKL
jgi:hypothetical protein